MRSGAELPLTVHHRQAARNTAVAVCRGRSADAHSPAVVRLDRAAADGRRDRGLRRRSRRPGLRKAGRSVARLAAYGERWARHWLDVVHYGDTHGFDKDKLRPNAWPYRDYVIRSLNDDKPSRGSSRSSSPATGCFPTQPTASSPWASSPPGRSITSAISRSPRPRPTGRSAACSTATTWCGPRWKPFAA